MDQQTFHLAVTLANAAFTTFRIAAHVPQLIAVVRDPCGARAISVASWLMFAMANLSNAVYALVMAADHLMFAINLVSAASCVVIASVARFKQQRADRSAHNEGDTGTSAADAPEPARSARDRLRLPSRRRTAGARLTPGNPGGQVAGRVAAIGGRVFGR